MAPGCSTVPRGDRPMYPESAGPYGAISSEIDSDAGGGGPRPTQCEAGACVVVVAAGPPGCVCFNRNLQHQRLRDGPRAQLSSAPGATAGHGLSRQSEHNQRRRRESFGRCALIGPARLQGGPRTSVACGASFPKPRRRAAEPTVRAAAACHPGVESRRHSLHHRLGLSFVPARGRVAVWHVVHRFSLLALWQSARRTMALLNMALFLHQVECPCAPQLAYIALSKPIGYSGHSAASNDSGGELWTNGDLT